MKRTNNLIIAALAMCIFSACRKDNGSDRTTLLAAGKWRFIEYTVTNTSTGAAYDNYTSLPACEKDNEYTFTTTGVHEYTEGATKCNAADPQIIYFAAWKFANNESVIQVTAGSQQLDYTILSLTASELLVEVIGTTSVDRIKFIH
jgi:Lipocalin-like domain